MKIVDNVHIKEETRNFDIKNLLRYCKSNHIHVTNFMDIFLPIYWVGHHLNKFTLYIIESNLIVKSSKYTCINNPELFETS